MMCCTMTLYVVEQRHFLAVTFFILKMQYYTEIFG